jgi:phosphohistidine phosphatase
MDLFLLRHAIAVERGTPGYEDDSRRPLTGKGAKKMRLIAEGMLALDLSFDVVLSSPFLRARQTAQIVVKVLDVPGKLRFSEHLEAGGDPESLIREIDDLYAKHSRILLVGHEPYLSSLISTLISGSDDLPITLKKGGLCKLSVDSLRYGLCATFEWLLAPSQMTRIR